MLDNAPFTLYNAVLGTITGVGVLYFLFFRPTVVEYRRSLHATVVGLVVFLIGGPVTELVAPWLVHWVHGTASVLVIAGLYDPLERELRRDAWSEVLLEHPEQLRRPEDWMLPVDDAVLDLFVSADLVLTPAVVAYNIDYSREEVNRRLIELEERGFVDKVERGKYRITALGTQYLNGTEPRSLRTRIRTLVDAVAKGE